MTDQHSGIVDRTNPEENNIPIDQVGCCTCGNLVSCICNIKKEHKEGCKFLRAARLSIELACDHGYQACPICDPCSCGLNPEPIR